MGGSNVSELYRRCSFGPQALSFTESHYVSLFRNHRIHCTHLSSALFVLLYMGQEYMLSRSTISVVCTSPHDWVRSTCYRGLPSVLFVLLYIGQEYMLSRSTISVVCTSPHDWVRSTCYRGLPSVLFVLLYMGQEYTRNPRQG